MGAVSDHSGPLLALCGIQGCCIREDDCFLWNQPQKISVFELTLLSTAFSQLPSPAFLSVISLWFF